MRLLKLAQLLQHKYKVASDVDQEVLILRGQIVSLHKALKNHNIIIACAESDAKNPKNPYEQAAVKGFQFCKDVVSIINYIFINRNELSLFDVREALLSLVGLIKDNLNVKFNKSGKPFKGGDESLFDELVQFAHVSELIRLMVSSKTKYDRKLRDQQYNKAKTGFSKILSIAISMIEIINKIKIKDPTKLVPSEESFISKDIDLPERFVPQRAALSENAINKFLMEHGAEYGINSQEDWRTVFEDNQPLKERMTTIINAINRGYPSINYGGIKEEISEILEKAKEAKKTNAPVFDVNSPLFNAHEQSRIEHDKKIKPYK